MGRLSPEASYQLRKAAKRLRERAERRSLLLEKARRAARLLEEEFGAREVWLFGSLLRPWFHEGSDVDLACTGVPPERVGAAWDRLVEALEEHVDLVALEEADERLRRRILADGERIA